jgi:cell surface protein SprA
MSLSMTSVQINEAISKDWVLGMGYKINNFNLFGGRNHRRVKSSNKGDDDEQQTSRTSSPRGGVNHDLNLRFDLSYRRQASITRDIASMLSAASSGNTAFKVSFTADYTMSKLITTSFYFDAQTNKPLLSSSSYPTTTYDFGLNFKLSLTR